MSSLVTHEQYIAQIAAIATRHVSPADRVALSGIKLVYGAGDSGTRGVTYFNRWGNGDDTPAPFVEVCAFGQSSNIQLVGTTLHELGHVLAGWEAGHGAGWKECCGRLGIRRIKAAGTTYRWSMIEPSMREAIAALATPTDGQPVTRLAGLPGAAAISLKPCQQGQGTRGGKSRGKGSGSRMRLYHCECTPPVKIRAGCSDLAVTCDHCSKSFNLV